MMDACMPAGPRILLDLQLTVVQVNPAAARLLARHGAILALQRQRLHAPANPTGLAQQLAAAARGARVALSLPQPGPNALTLSAERLATALGPCVLVRLRDPEQEVPDPQLLQSLFDLTPTEAQVAAALTLGQDSQEQARRMGVQLNTVQAHIKRVLLKSGTRRQSELVALVLRSVAMQPNPRHGEWAASPGPGPLPGPGLASPDPRLQPHH